MDSVYRGVSINSFYFWNCEGVCIKDGTEWDVDTQLVMDGQGCLTALKWMLLGEAYYGKGREQHIEVVFYSINGTFGKVGGKFRSSDKHVANMARFYVDKAGGREAYGCGDERQLTAVQKGTVAAYLKRLGAMETLPIAVYGISNGATLGQV